MEATTGANDVTAADVDVRVIDSDRASTAIRVTLAPNGAVPEGTGPAGQEITFTAQPNGAARSVDTVITLSLAGVTATATTDFAPSRR